MKNLIINITIFWQDYEKLLNSYQKNYLDDWEKKPIIKINVPFGKRKRIVFEIRREKDRA